MSVSLIVTDHGAANIEQMMDEALEDLPGLVTDIKEELRCMHTINIIKSNYYCHL